MSTKSSTKILMLPVLLAFGCSMFTPKAVPYEYENEEQVVYSFFINAGEGPALILEDTATGVSSGDVEQSLDYIKSGLPNLSRETIDNFIQRNTQPDSLSPDMDLGADYVLLTREELLEITSHPNWGELLTEAYPGSYGYTIFSRVGFNNSLDQALIYVGSVGGPLMGSGFYYLMEKKNGGWVIKEEIMMWIS